MQYHFILEISYFKWIIEAFLLKRGKSRRKMTMLIWNSFWFWWWISALFSGIYCGMATWHSAAQRLSCFSPHSHAILGAQYSFHNVALQKTSKYRCLNPLADTHTQMCQEKRHPTKHLWKDEIIVMAFRKGMRAAREGSGSVTDWRQLLENTASGE